MRKKVFLLFFIFVLGFSSVYAATTNDLGSNLKAALSQEESDSEVGFSHILDATKSDNDDPSGYIKYIKIDIDGDSIPELITITPNAKNGKTMYFYTLGDSNILYLGKKDFKDASYPFWFFQDKNYIVIDDTVEGFYRVQIKEGELIITSITDYPVDVEHQLTPLLYEEDLPNVQKNISSLNEKVQTVLNDDSLTDLKSSYKALFNSFVESNPTIVDQEEETVATFEVSYYLQDINNDNVSELIIVSDKAYIFTFNNGIIFLGSIFFQNSSFEKTGDNYLTVLTGKNDYQSYIIKMFTSSITLEHTYNIKDTDFNPHSKKILVGKTDTTDIDSLQNNPTKSTITEVNSTNTLPIEISCSTFIIVLFVVGLILFLKFKK